MKSWNYTDIQSCIGFNAAQNEWYSDCGDYAIDSLRDVAAIGVIVAVLTVLALAVYIFARFCGCLCCLARGCDLRARGASGGVVSAYRGLLVAVLLALVLFAILTSVYRSNLADELSSANTIVNQVRHTLTDNLRNASDTTSALCEREGLPQHHEVWRAYDKAEDWSRHAHNVAEIVQNSIWALDIFAWSSVVLFTVFVLTAVMNVHYCMPVVCFLLLVLFTVSGAATQVALGMTSTFASDTCTNFHSFNDSMTSFFESERFSRNHALGGHLSNLTAELSSDYAQKECSTDVATLCADWFTCGSTLSCEETLPTSAAFLREATKRAGDCVGCSIVQCATQCETGDARTLAMRVVSTQVKVAAELADIEAAVEPLYTGRLFETAIVSLRAPVCKDDSNMDETLHHLAIVLGFVAMGLLFATVLSGLGSYFYKGSIVAAEVEVITFDAENSYGTIPALPHKELEEMKPIETVEAIVVPLPSDKYVYEGEQLTEEKVIN